MQLELRENGADSTSETMLLLHLIEDRCLDDRCGEFGKIVPTNFPFAIYDCDVNAT